METNEAIETFTEYVNQVKSQINIDKHVLFLDIKEISKFNIEFAEFLLDNPDEISNLFDIIKRRLEFLKKCNIIIKNLPSSEELLINRIRTENLNKLVSIRGIVTTRTKVYPRIKSSRFECPACGNKMTIVQKDELLIEPSRCSCGKKGKFRLISNELENTLMLKIEELPERLKGSENPNDLRAIIEGELTKDDYKIHLGARIEFIGYIKEINNKTKFKTVNCDYMFIVLNYHNLDYVEFDTNLTKEEKMLFDELNKSPNPAKMISKWIFSDIHGYTKIKEALIYQQFCGMRYAKKRDFIHILLYGSPGTAKSDMAIRVSEINPISRIVTGTHVSGVGLTAAVKKDDLTGHWVAVGGLLPRCNGGLAVIDEIEKMNDEDKRSLHMPMESGFFGLEKAGISAKLVTNTAIVATSNQKVVEKPLKVVNNLDLPTAIVDRFDLIFTLRDTFDEKKDEIIAKNITNRAINEENFTTFSQKDTTFSQDYTTFCHNNTTFHISTLKKYIYLCKQINPKLSRRIDIYIHNWYVALRKASSYAGYEQKKPSPRVVESILRFARAIARSKQKDTITIIELKAAIEFFDFTYETNSLPEEVDVDELEKSKENKELENPSLQIKDIIIELSKKYGPNVPIDNLITASASLGLKEDKIEEVIEKMRKSGEIFEPKPGFVKVL